MCLLNTFCSRYSLKTGVLCIATIRLIVWVGFFAYCIADDESDTWFHQVGFYLYFPVFMVTELLLLIGALRRNRCLLIFWLFPTCFGILFIITSLAGEVAVSPSNDHTIIVIIKVFESLMLIFSLYCLLLVVSFIVKIRNSRGRVLQPAPQPQQSSIGYQVPESQHHIEHYDPPPPYSPPRTPEYERQPPTAPGFEGVQLGQASPSAPPSMDHK